MFQLALILYYAQGKGEHQILRTAFETKQWLKDVAMRNHAECVLYLLS